MTAEPEFNSQLQMAMRSSDELVGLMSDFFTKLDTRRSHDFTAIAAEIEKAKEHLHSLRPQDISQTRLPHAGAELLAITRDTENATDTIMTAAEAMLGFDANSPRLKEQVDEEVMKIFEACSFQDITGQRVTKIVQVLSHIEERVSRLAAAIGVEDAPAHQTPDDLRRQELLLNGPAIGGPETKQSDVDDLFASTDTNAVNSQESVDALFD